MQAPPLPRCARLTAGQCCNVEGDVVKPPRPSLEGRSGIPWDHLPLRTAELLSTVTQEEPRPLGATREQSLPIPGSSCAQMSYDKMTQTNRFSSTAVPRQRLQNAGESCGRLEELSGMSLGEHKPPQRHF